MIFYRFNKMIKLFIVLFFLITPLAAFAAGGSLTLTGVTHYEYQRVNDNLELLYKIKAQKQYETIKEINSSEIIDYMYNKESAKKRFHYENAQLILSDKTKINFILGYFFKGNLIMNHVYGIIDGENFHTSELLFNQNTTSLMAKNILFTIKNKKISKKNFMRKSK